MAETKKINATVDLVKSGVEFKLNGGTILSDDGTSHYLHSQSNLYLYSGSSNTMVLTNAGNVGIGTTSPSQKLDVIGNVKVGDGSADNYVQSVFSDGSETRMHGYGFYMSRTNSYIRPTNDGTQILAIGTDNHTWNYVAIDANYFTVSTNASEHFRITNTGNVGIGTTSPSSKLHIENAGNTWAKFINTSGTNQRLDVGTNSSSQHFVFGYGAYPVLFGTNGTERMRIDNGGTVSIGTTAAYTTGGTSKLTISGILSIGASNSDLSYIRRIGTGEYQWQTFNSGNSGEIQLQPYGGNVGIGTTSPNEKLSVNGNIESLDTFVLNYGNNGIKWQQLFDGANSWNLRYFNGSWSSAAMTVTAAGNVGIGTTSPGHKLDVGGSININNTSYAYKINDLNVLSASGTYTNLHTPEGAVAIYLGDSGDRTNYYDNNTHRFRGAGGSGDKMFINSSGNVGIGTTSPNHKLDIYSNENVPLRVHRPNNANLDSSGAWGIGFSTRSDGNNSVTDTRAGIFSYYNGNLFLAAANTSIVADPDAYARLTILNSGNVGIGTTSPGAELHVKGAGEVFRLQGDTGQSYMTFFQGTGGRVGYLGTAGSAGIILESSDQLQLYAGSSEVIRITSSGNVGIGTTSPAYKLDVVGTMRIAGNEDATNLRIAANLSTVSGTAYQNYNELLFENTGITYGNAGIRHLGNAWLDGKSALAFFTSSNIGSFDERMRIDASGSVGIGTTSPGAKLDITTDHTSQIPIRVTHNNYNDWLIQKRRSDDTQKLGIKEVNSNGGMGFATADTVRMVIDSSGNVGIGTTSPDTKLEVRTPINTESSIRIRQLSYNYWDLKSPASDTGFTIGDVGGEKLRITSSGNVGIGTTSPGRQLELRGQGVIRLNAISGGDPGLDFNTSDVNDMQIRYRSTTDALAIYSYGTSSDVLTIRKSDGNVGIGTTSPDTKLHIYENAAAPVLLTLNNYQSDINPNGSQGNFIDFKMTDDNATFTPQVRIGMIVKDSDGDSGLISEGCGNFVVYTAEGTDQAGNGTLTEHFRITDKGNVGIGTTSPASKLDVAGAVRALGLGSYFGNSSTSYSYAVIGAFSNGADNIPLVAKGYSGQTADLTRWVDSNNNILNVVDASGNVGIGTTSPSSKLHINTENSPTTLSITRGGTDLSTSTSIGRISFDADFSGSLTNYGYISLGSNNINGVRASMDFAVKSTSGTVTNGMTLYGTNAGVNVGIGTSTPGHKLEVSGVISAGTDNSTSGSLILVGKYNNGNITTIGSGYSAGGAVIGYGVKPSTTAAGAFLSSSALASLERSAYVQYGSTHQWWTGAYQTVAVDSAATLSQVMTLDGSGNLGIGTTSPSYRLHVDNDASNTNNAALYVRNPNSSSGAVIAEFVGDSDAIQIKNINVGDYVIYNTQQSNGIALYDGTGGVEIHYNGATVLEADSNGGIKVTGQLSATGDVVAYSSDERLKENIKPIENAVDKIKQLKGVTFDWNEKSQELGFEPSTKTNDVGVIAQDVEAVFPQLVHLAPFDIGSDEEGKATSKTGEDYKTVNYARLTAVLIEAVKEQQQQIDELKEIINGLTK